MLHTIIEYTGFFLVLIFALGIIASVIFAVWDEFQASKSPVINFLKRKPGNMIRILKYQFYFRFTRRRSRV
jgi:hypothetical protein